MDRSFPPGWDLAIEGRLAAEECADLSDSELIRCLADCVAAIHLIPIAQELRDRGALVMRDGCVALVAPGAAA